MEFDITKRYLDEYISCQNLEIFDIGGGPGRYALYLSQKGHKVSLLDLSQRNIEVAKAETAKRGICLEAYIHGNALELSEYEQKFDVVLLMGPLYHLTTEAERKRAIEGALGVLKPGGLFVITFISSYAPLFDNLKALYPVDSVDDLLQFLQAGESRGEGGFTKAYFWRPEQAREMMREAEINSLKQEDYEKWLEVCYP